MGANADLIRSVWAAFASGDVEWGTSRFADDAEIVVPASLPWSGAARGPEGYRTMAGRVRGFLSEFRPAPERFIEDGDQVAVPINLHGRTTTGEEIAWRALWLYRVESSQIARAELFLDTARAIEDTAAARAAAGE